MRAAWLLKVNPRRAAAEAAEAADVAMLSVDDLMGVIPADSRTGLLPLIYNRIVDTREGTICEKALLCDACVTPVGIFQNSVTSTRSK